jgi:GNAT superfamily N-acetyltransferase
MREEIVVRAALAHEREMLEALQWRASLSNPGDREILLANPDAIMLPANQIEAGFVVLVEIEGVCAGFAAILPRADGDMELDGLFVESDRWKRGIGQALIQHCCALSQKLGAVHLHVVGNPHALGFYEKCGFKSEGWKEMRFGSGMTMRKRL